VRKTFCVRKVLRNVELGHFTPAKEALSSCVKYRLTVVQAGGELGFGDASAGADGG
jgi:hypothetical protein